MPLPRLNVQANVAAGTIRGLIADGEMLLSEFARGVHNPRIVLQHRIKVSNWSRAAEDRVNSLFADSALYPGSLLTMDGNSIQLGTLRDLLSDVEPAQVRIISPELLASRQRLLKEAQERMDPLNIERVGLHPKVLERCKELYAVKKYDDAVFNAFKLVETEIRARIGAAPENLGTDLVSMAMNPKKPILELSSIFGEQDGFHLLFRGAIALFKNPLSHRFLDIDDQLRAFELLTFASLLMRLLEEANVKLKRADGLP